MNSLAEKEHSKGRSQRWALLAIWSAIGAVGLILILYGQIKLREARESIDWPVAPGTITTSKVRTHVDAEGTTYSADIEYMYMVDDVWHSSDVVVLGGHEYGAQSVVARYPEGTRVRVSYNPQEVSRAVLEPGVESHSYQTIGIIMILGSCGMAFLFDFIMRLSIQEKRNALDNKLLFALKLLFFPLTFCNGNIWIVVLLVGIAAGLTMLELPTALNIVATSFATFYGLLLVLMLWGRFIGWLASLAEEPDK